MPVGVPHSFMIAADVDGDDIWVGTAKGLGWGIGEGYYPGTKERRSTRTASPRRSRSRRRPRRAEDAAACARRQVHEGREVAMRVAARSRSS